MCYTLRVRDVAYVVGRTSEERVVRGIRRPPSERRSLRVRVAVPSFLGPGKGSAARQVRAKTRAGANAHGPVRAVLGITRLPFAVPVFDVAIESICKPQGNGGRLRFSTNMWTPDPNTDAAPHRCSCTGTLWAA